MSHQKILTATYVGYSMCLKPVCRGKISTIGATAATNHLSDLLQSKYGRVHRIGPGFSSAPAHTNYYL